MKINWRTELIQLAPIAAMFVVAALAWPNVPDRIPVHWNIHGEVDGYGGKFAGLLLFPIIASGLYLLTLTLPLVDPLKANYAAFARSYGAIRLSITLFMAVFFGATVLVALGHPVNINTVVGVALGMLFVALGSVMGRIQPNWFVGVRTPWTLSSTLSWTKTHRLAGWVFVAMGIAAVVWALLPSVWMFAAMMAFDAAGVTWIIVYSYLVYRRDPARLGGSAAEQAR